MPGGTSMELFTLETLHFSHKLVNSELICALYSRAVTTRLLLFSHNRCHDFYMKYCSNCGSRLADGQKFCHECGHLLSPEQPSLSAQPAVSAGDEAANESANSIACQHESAVNLGANEAYCNECSKYIDLETGQIAESAKPGSWSNCQHLSLEKDLRGPNGERICANCGVPVSKEKLSELADLRRVARARPNVGLIILAVVVIGGIIIAAIPGHSDSSSSSDPGTSMGQSADSSSTSGFTSGSVTSDSSAGDFVTGETRNLMRLNGVDAFDNQGNSISLHAFAVELLNHFETTGGAPRTFTQSEVKISEEPGNTLDRLLNEFFTDQDAISVVKDELISLAESDPAARP